jgi:hypothetical protein
MSEALLKEEMFARSLAAKHTRLGCAPGLGPSSPGRTMVRKEGIQHMDALGDAKRLLKEINEAISAYDPVLREKARDILLTKAFGSDAGTNSLAPTNGHSTLSPPWNNPSKIELKTLIDRWMPKTQSQRALLCAYYLQRLRGYQGMTGRDIQDNLKVYGLRLSNVSVAIGENTKKEPPRMMGMKLTGETENRYVITNAGVEYVEHMLYVSGLSGRIQTIGSESEQS